MPVFATLAGLSVGFAGFEKQRVRAAVRARLTGRPVVAPTLGRYTIERRLGRGAMGQVYVASDATLHRQVALKVIRCAADESDGVLAEAHLLAKLSHPNVVAVYDAGYADGHVFIAMEFVAGVTLDAWAARTRHRTAKVIAVMLSAGRGLVAAHALGIIHRDFKPANVIVGDDGRVRVLDFGLALQANPTTAANANAGTPEYMAPEQRLGPATVQSDQYSYCVTFHELLAGHRPRSNGLSRVLLPWLRPIVSRGLRSDPAARHASIAVLIRRFERRRGLMLAAAALLAAGAGALAYALVSA